MLLKEIKKPKNEVVRDAYGKPLRGLAKEIALRRRKAGYEFKDYDIKDDRIGVAKVVKEEALETKTIEDLWSENADSIAKYESTATYLVRPIKGTNPTKYEVKSVIGTTSKPYGEFTAAELKDALEPIRPNQTPDAEGYVTYIDPEKVDAFQYSGDPVKVTLSDTDTQTLKDGDYVVRSVEGDEFVYDIEKAGDFESQLKKA